MKFGQALLVALVRWFCTDARNVGTLRAPGIRKKHTGYFQREIFKASEFLRGSWRRRLSL